MKKKEMAILAFILLIQLLLISYFVRYRIVDRDEGLYLYLAREVSYGKTPYVDFFFPQMPLILYLLAPFSHFGWNSLLLTRAIYGVASFALGLAVFRYLYRWGNGFAIAASGLSLYAFSGFLVSWHTVLQFNVLTDLLLFSAFLSFLAGLHSGRSFYHVVTGLLLGLAVALRVVFLPLIPLFLFLTYFFYRRDSLVKVSRNMLLQLGGNLLGGSLPIYFLARCGIRFVRNTIVFQLLRQRFFPEVPGLWAAVRHNLATLGKFLLFPQTGLVVLLSVSAFLFYRRSLSRGQGFAVTFPKETILLLIGLVIFVSHVFVTPSFFHYFVQILPPLIAFSAPFLPRLASTRRLVAVSAAVAVIYVASIAVPIGLHVKAWMPKYRNWRPANLKRISQRIMSLTSPDEEVLSYWAGFPVLAERKGVEGAAPWERTIAVDTTEDSEEKYGLASKWRLMETISQKKAALIVAPPGLKDASAGAIEEHYQKVEDFEGFVIYSPKGAGI